MSLRGREWTTCCCITEEEIMWEQLSKYKHKKAKNALMKNRLVYNLVSPPPPNVSYRCSSDWSCPSYSTQHIINTHNLLYKCCQNIACRKRPVSLESAQVEHYVRPHCRQVLTVPVSVVSLLLYSYETRTILAQRDQAFETKRLRKHLRIACLEHKTNVWVRSISTTSRASPDVILCG